MRVSATPFISFVSEFTDASVKAYHEFSVGRLIAIVSFDILPANLGDSIPIPITAKRERETYVVVELMQHLHGEQSALYFKYRDMRGLMEPWAFVGTTSPLLQYLLCSSGASYP